MIDGLQQSNTLYYIRVVEFFEKFQVVTTSKSKLLISSEKHPENFRSCKKTYGCPGIITWIIEFTLTVVPFLLIHYEVC